VSRSDEELLAAVKGGDASATEELLARHEREIYRFGLRMCGNEEDARDVLQETLLAAFRNLSGFRGDARLSTWLYQIARSFCIKQRRPHSDVRAEPIEPRVAHQVPSGEAGADERVHARQIGELLSAEIAKLPDGYREALVLRDVEGLSAEEAAAVAGVEVGALKSRLHRARLELRAHLAERLGERAVGGPPPCAELAQELSAYADADVDQATCTKIEEHLARCPRCAGACEALKRTVSLCRRIPGDEVPPAVRAAVRQALHSLAPV
jgi:RNA polymerase sigma-70 factor (ECF subfamily)